MNNQAVPLARRTAAARAAVLALSVLALQAARADTAEPGATAARVPPRAAARAPAPRGLDTPMSVDFRQVSVASALRVVAEASGLNLVATPAAAQRELTMVMQRSSAGAVLDGITRISGLWYRWRDSAGAYLVMTAEEYQRDVTVFREEQTLVLPLRHHNVVAAAHALRALFGSRVRLNEPREEPLGERLGSGDLRRGGSTAATAAAGQNAAAQAAGAVSASRGGLRAASDGTPEAVQHGTDADTARALQSGDDAPLYVTYSKLHNLLILRTGDEKVLAQVRRFVEQIDLPARQVLLEMRIIEVRLDDEFHRAFDLDFFSKGQASGVASTASGQSVNPLTGASSGPRSVGALGNYSQYENNTSVFQFLSNRIRLRLQLLEEQGRVQTVARPLLLASNNEPARLFIGEEVVLTTGATAQTTTGTTGATNTTITAETEKRDIGTTLLIHPRINADRSVTLTIDQESSVRVAGGTTIPLATGSDEGNGVIQFPIDTVNTATVQAVALAQDGLTIAVGGMVRETRSRTEGNVPGLSSVPLLREVFKKDERSGERYEMVLVITPHVLESAEQAEDVTRRLRERDADIRAPEVLPAGS
ncbi:type II secretion system protein GspD [Rubrivivax gelatinosus]|uniref:General secretion pathway protein D n=1 Tax=Rubrivivax gelatinosus TaxID=28068 RepID=A0A4R2M5M2_RUBGE|nr:hypothetical protein [Rubrivivax gelatinosus]MBK1690495.1 hypothetical protein [Rubrivivax gelatinosus]TCP01510.1 general secretion pathway protein D [Rubrivivax gelatinosus]